MKEVVIMLNIESPPPKRGKNTKKKHRQTAEQTK
jgi:hypothetical protein